MNEGQSNDHDFVPPTQYKLHHIKQKPSGFSPLKLILRFNAMDLNHITSSSQIPNMINSSSPEALFTLFFTDLVINRIIQCINVNAESVQVDPVTSRAQNSWFHNSYNQLPWKPVTSSKILAFLRILIYMGIYPMPRINDYWNIKKKAGICDDPHRLIRLRISGCGCSGVSHTILISRTRALSFLSFFFFFVLVYSQP